MPSQGIDIEEPPMPVRTTKVPPPANKLGLPRVVTLDETLDKETTPPSSSSSLNSNEGNLRNTPINTDYEEIEHAELPTSHERLPGNQHDSGSKSEQLENLRATAASTSNTKETAAKGGATNVQNISVPRVGAHWMVFLSFLVIYSCIWIAIFCALFDIHAASSIQGTFSTIFFIDSGDWLYKVRTPSWILGGSYIIFILVGRILTGALVFSVWPNISNFLSSTGKELFVTTAVLVRS